MKKTVFILIGLLALAVAAGVFVRGPYSPEAGDNRTPAKSPKDATYLIEGQPVTLVDGLSEIEAVPGSASKKTTRYFGNEVIRDLDGDGREDAVFLLTQQTGGSGTFYYAVAALNTESGYIGSQGFFLGDRIAPQTTEISRNPSHKDVIVVNYAERAPGESFDVRPSVGRSVWLKLDPKIMQFGEVIQDFEGEADPSRMTLGMKTWVWMSALYNDGKEIRPKQLGRFSISFSDGGKFSAATDCNSMTGSYTAAGGTISFSSIASTKMFCAGSQEAQFAALLQNAESYHFTSKGELILGLKFDSGSAVFR